MINIYIFLRLCGVIMYESARYNTMECTAASRSYMYIFFCNSKRKQPFTIYLVITHWSAGSVGWENWTMTAENVVTQLHIQTDLTSMRKFKSYVHIFTVRGCGHSRVSRHKAECNRTEAAIIERQRGQSVRLPNCPTLDLMKIKVFLLGPKIIHQMSKLVWHETCGMCVYFYPEM